MSMFLIEGYYENGTDYTVHPLRVCRDQHALVEALRVFQVLRESGYEGFTKNDISHTWPSYFCVTATDAEGCVTRNRVNYPPDGLSIAIRRYMGESTEAELVGGPLDGTFVPLTEDSIFFGAETDNGFPVYEGDFQREGENTIFAFVGYATTPTKEAWRR